MEHLIESTGRVPPSKRSNRFGFFSIILICSLGILVYSNSFICSFHFDDVVFIINNFNIRNIYNLQGVWNWWPCRFITFLSFAFNYRLHQLDVGGYHLFNLIVHLFSSVLVWWLVCLTLSTPVLKDKPIARHSNLIALLSGLIFVAHPIQTQAVTFIWQRAASMAALFYLASLCFYIKSRLNQGAVKFYYTCSLITAIMAMLTKENTVTLPLMIAFYQASFLKADKNINWKPLAPFFFFFLIIPALGVLSRPEKVQAAHSFVSNISPLQYFLTELRVLLTYVRLIFVPLNQNLDYDYSLTWALLTTCKEKFLKL